MVEQAVRKKPWYRLRNLILGALALIVVCLGWAFFEVWKVYTGEPKITRDYRAEFRKLSEKAAGVPEGTGDEAWSKFIDASGQCAELLRNYEQRIKSGELPPRVIAGEDFDDRTVDFALVREGDSLADHIQREREAIQMMREAGVFDRLAEFASLGIGFRTGDNTVNPIEELLPELNEARGLAKARAASMRLAMAENNAADVAAAFDQVLAICQTASHQSPVVYYLVALSIELLACTEAQHLLMEYEFDEASCRKLLDSLAARPLADIAVALEGERAFFHDFVQRFYTDNGRGDGFATGIEESQQNRTFQGAALGRFVLATRKETLSKYDQYIAGMVGESKLPANKRWIDFDPHPDPKKWGYRHALLAIMLPALQKTIDTATIGIQKREAMRVMIALEMFYALHKRWPNSLDELIPSILSQAPRDPLHDGPFGYRLLENDPHHRPYLLYSFGPDAQDDGGKMTENELEDHRRGKNPLQRGFDDVFNTPRRPSQLEATPRDETGDLEADDGGEIETGTETESEAD